MTIQRIPIAANPLWAGRPITQTWALVDGPVAIRPAFEITEARGWVVCHVPSGLYIRATERKADALSLATALRDVLPTTGTLGVSSVGKNAVLIRAVLMDWENGAMLVSNEQEQT